jgi:hypothetical protein
MPRSLARRNDGESPRCRCLLAQLTSAGCYECCKRRLRCDKTEPECLKCQKKGIQCSGQGLRCRFSSHMSIASSPSTAQNTRPKAKSKQASPRASPPLTPPTPVTPVQPFPSPGIDGFVGFAAADELPWDMGWVETPTTTASPSPSSALIATSPSESHQEKADRLLSLIRIGGTPLRAAIDEPLHPQARMLFSHCTSPEVTADNP